MMTANDHDDRSPDPGSAFPRRQRTFERENLQQIRAMGRIKPNSVGGEVISFTIPMGPIDIICVANVPGDGEEEAPVYIKFRFNGSQHDRARPPNGRRHDDGDDGPDDDPTPA